MSTLPTYDYETEQANLLRKMRMAEAMQQGGLAPIEAPPNNGRVSWTQGLAKLAQAYMGAKGVESVTDQQRQLGTRYKADLHKGVSDFIDGTSMTPGMQPAVTGNNPSAYVAPTMMDAAGAAQTKKSAIMQALASNHPVLQQLAMAEMKKASEGKLTPDKFLGHADAPTIKRLAEASGLAGFQPKVDLKPATPGDAYINDSGQMQQPGAPGAAASSAAPAGFAKVDSPSPGIDIVRETTTGDLYQRTATGLKKLDNAPKTTVQVTNSVSNKGESAFAKKIGELTATDVDEVRKASAVSQKMLPVLAKLEALNKNPTYSGPTADPSIWMGQVARMANIPVDVAKLSGSEEYQAVIGKQIASYLTAGGGVGRSMTDADREAILSQFPTLVKTPEGRVRAVEMLRTAAMSDIEHSKRVEEEIKTQFPELGRVRSVAPANSSPYPQKTSPTPDRASQFRVIR
jgi:hypothetical protein